MIYNLLAFLISVLALLVGYLTFRIQNRKKSLCYKFRTSPIVTYFVSDEHKGKLKLIYDNKEVSNPKTIDVEVWNDGQIPIKKDDYSSPIQLSMPNNCKILGYSLVHVFPDNVEIKLSEMNHGIAIEPTLLNPGDKFSCRITVDHPTSLQPKVHARISGINKIEASIDDRDIAKKSKVADWVWLFTGAVAGAFITFLIRLSEL